MTGKLVIETAFLPAWAEFRSPLVSPFFVDSKSRSGRQSSLLPSTLLTGSVFHTPFPRREGTRAHFGAMPSGKEILTPETCHRRAGHKEFRPGKCPSNCWGQAHRCWECAGVDEALVRLPFLPEQLF